MKVHLATKFADKVRVSPPLVVLLALTEKLEIGKAFQSSVRVVVPWLTNMRSTETNATTLG